MGQLKTRVVFGVLLAAYVSAAGLLLRAEPPQAVGTWASLGTTPESRVGAAAVALPDGRTLIAGGSIAGAATDSVVVFDPADGSFASAGHLLLPRVGHTATLLDDGRVLIAGGTAGDLLSADLELFDPSSGNSVLGGAMAQPRTGHAAARLADGKVLIAGGTSTDGVLQSAEIYDPATGATTPTTLPMLVARTGASATTLIDGRVLIAGGNTGPGTADLASAELFEASSQIFEAATTSLSVPRSGHAAVLLPWNNSVLITGGSSNGVAQTTSDLFLPAEFPDPYSYGMGSFAPTGSLVTARSGAVASPHIEGYAVTIGGGAPEAEVYRFATIKTDKDDYAPGTKAIITGSGWEPNTDVTLVFQEDPAVHDDYILHVTSKSDGTIYWDQWAPEEHDLNVRFYLMAKQATPAGERRAQTTFTDARNLTLTFSGAGTGSVTLDTTTGIHSGTFKVPVACGGTNSSITSWTFTSTCTSISLNDNDATGTLTANPNAGSAFGGWSGPGNFTGCTSTTSPCAFSVTGSSPAITATFNAAVATTTTVSSSVNPSTYGDSVTFTATVSSTSTPTGSVNFIVDGGSPVAGTAGATTATTAQWTYSTSALNAGTHTVSASYVHSGSFQDSSGSLSGGQVVNKASPTATLAVTNSPQTYTGSGLAAIVGITVSSVPGTVANILTGGAAAQTPAGTYAVTADFVPNDTANYNTLLAMAAGNFTVEKATLTYTASGSKTYGSTTDNSTASGFATFFNGDTALTAAGFVAPVCTSATGAVGTAAVGTYTINCAAGAATNYTVAAANFPNAFTVEKATLTYTASGSKTYGSTTDNSTASGFATFFNGDTALTAAGFVAPVCTSATGAVGTAAVGTYTINCAAGAATNYTVAAANFPNAFTVEKATLTYTASGSKTYGSTTDNSTASGFATFFNGDTALTAAGFVAPVCTSATGAVGTAAVGTYTINCAAGAATNYTVAAANFPNAFTVEKATLTYTASGSKTYGSTTDNSTASGFATFFNGDTALTAAGFVAPVCTSATGAVGTAAVGTYTINCAAGAATNYTVAAANFPNAFTVEKATLTYTASGSKTYGSTTDNSTASGFATFFNGDTALTAAGFVAPVCTSATGAVGTAAVGTYTINCAAGAATNYTVAAANFPNAFTVEKATLTYTASGSKTYGSTTDNSTASGFATFFNGDTALTAAGFVAPVCTSATGAVGTAAVGTYTINCAAGAATNYTVAAANFPNAFTVEKATLTYTASGSKTYGSTTDNSTASGFATFFNGDTALTAAGFVAPVCTSATGAVGTAAVGTYTINCAAGAATNYTVAAANFPNAFTVEKATLTYTASGSKTYGSTTDNSTASGFATFFNGDTALTAAGFVAPVCTSATGAVGTAAVGTYTINCAAGAATNYTVAAANFPNAFTVEKATLTYTASGSKTYGSTTDNSTASGFATFFNGDTALTAAGFVAPVCTSATGAVGTAAVGTYTINCAAGAATNYTVAAANFPNAFTVEKATLTYTASGSKTYGSTTDNSTASGFATFFNGDTALTAAGFVAPVCTSATGAVGTAAVGTYTINCAAGAATNYTVAAANFSNAFTVEKATLDITAADGKSKFYGDTFTAFTGSVVGLKNSDAVVVTYASIGAPAAAAAGSYDITVASYSFTVGSASNYDIHTHTATNGLTVNKANATVAVTPYNVQWDGNSHTATYTITGVNGETGATVGAVTLDTTHTNAGTYSTDSWSFAPTANYNPVAGATITDVIGTAYCFNGFLSPIGGSVETSNGGSFLDPVRAFKLGSTIPIKFILNSRNGTTCGAVVTTGIHTLQAIYYSSAVASEDAIDASPTDAATTDSQFRLTNPEWHFNLSTKGFGFKAGTWLLKATLWDGSVHTVWITIKK